MKHEWFMYGMAHDWSAFPWGFLLMGAIVAVLVMVVINLLK